MKTVHEVSRMSGVSVRALHHYDSIGLLKPTELTDAGYRLYDEKALCRLKSVLMFRELGFSLADIKQILDSPDFDLKTALVQHVEMLKLQREHIDGLISEAEKIIDGGNAGISDFDFSAFDRSSMERYANEVKEKWGGTDAYRESKEKFGSKTDAEKKSITDGLMAQFSAFGSLKALAPDSEEAQSAVAALQNYITSNFYKCTKEILSGLGVMYVADDRFRANIDSAGGEGTADFVSKAIKIYCK